MLRIESGAYTDAGDIRNQNQDHIYTQTGEIAGRTAGLFMVADGCGGLEHGGEISALLAKACHRFWMHTLPAIMEATSEDAQIDGALEQLIQDANCGAFAFGKQTGSSVGSTLSLLLLVDRRYYIKNVGDSRIYLLRRKLRLLTQDQSLLADMLRNREISAREAAQDSRKNILTMCIGAFEQVRTFSCSGELKKGDRFLLCSDGLYQYISRAALTRLLKRRHMSLQQGAACLRRAIPAGGAQDNVSAILVHVSAIPLNGWYTALLLAGVALLCGALVAIGWYVFI